MTVGVQDFGRAELGDGLVRGIKAEVGFKRFRYPPGMNLAVETPVNLTGRQKELLREFENLSEENNPEGESFFSKVKGFWDGKKG
jgi:hypothetical protein